MKFRDYLNEKAVKYTGSEYENKDKWNYYYKGKSVKVEILKML